MALKLIREGLFNWTFNVIDGFDSVGKLKMPWFGRAAIATDAEFINNSDSIFYFYKIPKTEGKFGLKKGNIGMALATELSIDYPDVDLDYQGEKYLLKRDSKFAKEFSLFNGKKPCGSLYKDNSFEYFATINMLDTLPVELRVFCFWLAMFYWQGRGTPQV